MTLLNTVETYQSLQPFTSIEELNENTKSIREQFGIQLTPSTLKVLDVLARYSCKFYGVSYRSKSKIAMEVGISYKTVTRACNALESLGVIEQHELKRYNGDRRQSANAIVFVRLTPIDLAPDVEDVVPSCPTKDTLSNTTNTKPKFTLDTGKQVIVDKKVVKEISKVDTKRGLHDKMPSFIYSLLSSFLNESDLFTAYGTILRSKASIDRSITLESYQGLYSDAIMSVIHSYKRGKVRSLFAVLYTAIQDTSAQIYRKENYNVPDWLSFVTH